MQLNLTWCLLNLCNQDVCLFLVLRNQILIAACAFAKLFFCSSAALIQPPIEVVNG